MKHITEYPDVLANINRRIARLERTNPTQAKKERKELDNLLEGKINIERSMLCKNCKYYAKMTGEVTVLPETQQLRRTFTCTECHLPAHVDFIQAPQTRAFQILTK